MTQQPADLFTAIDHVGVAVRDLDAAIAFYRDTYGMTLLHEEVNEEQGVREAMMAWARPAHASSCSHRSHRSRRSPSSWIGPAPESSRSPTAWLTSTPCRRRCVSGDFACCIDAPRRGTADSRVNFIHPKDAGGVLVELVEPA